MHGAGGMHCIYNVNVQRDVKNEEIYTKAITAISKQAQ